MVISNRGNDDYDDKRRSSYAQIRNIEILEEESKKIFCRSVQESQLTVMLKNKQNNLKELNIILKRA